MSEWQPIETAPPDTPVLTWHPEAKHRIMTMSEGDWNGREWWCSMDDDRRYMVVGQAWEPTHWMPLPEPPK